ncbi:MAG: DUF5329 family protein [Syntrophales bacterium]|nr:DUF5329 family protein [Syntrophales bacterium]MDD5533915.1 DUF5329 family protein [Syntrophales bacterium]HPL62734.1 DUF5329 family protein [Syntrophales bacterium]
MRKFPVGRFSTALAWTIIVLSLCAGPASSASAVAAGLPAAERQKIVSLIENVESLRGAIFIHRNREYGTKLAARYLRWKWKTSRDRVKTAEEFVELASVSPSTGKPYNVMVRLRDGRELTGKDFLFSELRRLDRS